MSANQAITFNLTAAEDKPVVTGVTAVTLTDTANDDTFANQTGTLTATSRDGDTAFTWNIVGGEATDGADAAANFVQKLVGDYGTLLLKANGDYVFRANDGAIEALEANATQTFNVTATADGAVSANQAITFNIASANDKPTLTVFAASVDGTNEDTAVQITFAELVAQGNEADRDNNVTAFVVTSVAAGATLTINGQPYAAGTNDVVDAAKPVTFTPAANAYGKDLVAFSVKAKDNLGALSDTAVDVRVNVAAVVDAGNETAEIDGFVTNAANLVPGNGNGIAAGVFTLDVTTDYGDNDDLSPSELEGILVASNAAGTTITVNANTMDLNDLEKVLANIAKVDTITNLTLTQANIPGADAPARAANITTLLGKVGAGTAAVTATGLSINELKALADSSAKINANGLTGAFQLDSTFTTAQITSMLGAITSAGATVTVAASAMSDAQLQAVVTGRAKVDTFTITAATTVSLSQADVLNLIASGVTISDTGSLTVTNVTNGDFSALPTALTVTAQIADGAVLAPANFDNADGTRTIDTVNLAAGVTATISAADLVDLIAKGVSFAGTGVLNVTGYDDHVINSANISNQLDIRVALAAGTNHVLDAADATRLAQADRLVISNGQALTINADQLPTLAELKGIVGTAGGDAESVTIADGAATTIDLKRISTIDNIDSFKVIGDAGANVIQLSTALSVSGKARVYLSGLDGANPNFATDGQVDKLIFNLTKDQGFGLDAGVYRTEGAIAFNKVYGFTAGSDDFGIFYGATNAISRFSTTTSEVGALVGTLVEDAGGPFMDSSSVTELSTLRDSIAAVVASTALDANGYGRFTGLTYSGQSTADADKSAAFLYAVEVQGTAAETAAQSVSNLTTSSKFGVATLAEIVSIADTALSNVDITSKPAGLS